MSKAQLDGMSTYTDVRSVYTLLTGMQHVRAEESVFLCPARVITLQTRLS